MSQQVNQVSVPPVRPGEIADDPVGRSVCGISGLGYVPACQQLIADQSAQLPRRIAASLRVVHIVAECPPAVRFPVIAWVLWVQRVIAELSPVELSHLYVRQYVPGIGQVSCAQGKSGVPGRPSGLILTLRLISAMVRVPRTGAMLCQPGCAITLGTCGGRGMAQRARGTQVRRRSGFPHSARLHGPADESHRCAAQQHQPQSLSRCLCLLARPGRAIRAWSSQWIGVTVINNKYGCHAEQVQFRRCAYESPCWRA